MTCIKTGARVLLTNYGVVVPADLHRVGNTIVVHMPVGAFEAARSDADWNDDYITHEVHIGSGAFWQRSIGVLVVPSQLVIPRTPGAGNSMMG